MPTSRARIHAALLAIALSGCAAYKLPVLPEIPSRAPNPIPIFIPTNTPKDFGDYRGTDSDRAVGFAVKLEKAGFLPTIVSQESQIPPNAVVIFEVRRDDRYKYGCDTNMALDILAVVTLGLVPDTGCMLFGNTFDLRRSIDAPPHRIDTQFRVPAMAGWFAAPIGLFAGYTPGSVPEAFSETREVDSLRTAILDALAAPSDPAKPSLTP